ncbi:hypothetical protein HWV62_33875 [Athelia sp. TMB]|nr:hypothetical protein HWV62_33875 [Athelia sp. TMB]
MDVLYNTKAAGAWHIFTRHPTDTNFAALALAGIFQERAEGNASTLQLANYQKVSQLAQAMYPIHSEHGAQSADNGLGVVRTTAPASTRLALFSEGGTVLNEVVLRVQGILCHQQLPPLKHIQMPSDGNPRFMKQCIRITGFGDGEFERAVNGAAQLAIFMQENIDPGSVDSWSPDRFQTWSALEFTNRYFVRQNIEGDMIAVEFGRNVDNEGLLTKIAGTEWVHTEENRVRYFNRVKDEEGKLQYLERDPGAFKMGEIVEIQFSMLAFHRRGKDGRGQPQRHSIKLVLRALTLLDDSYVKVRVVYFEKTRLTMYQDALSKRLKASTTIPPTPSTPSRGLKRYVGYKEDSDEDDSRSPTKKMREMCIDDGHK